MSEAFSREDIHEMVGRHMARPPQPGELRIVTDTSEREETRTGQKSPGVFHFSCKSGSRRWARRRRPRSRRPSTALGVTSRIRAISS